MTEDPDLLNALFGIGQIFCLLLLLFGGYLSTLEAVLAVEHSDDNGRQPERSNFNYSLFGTKATKCDSTKIL